MTMSEDFLKSPVSFEGRDVFILGSGPNGSEHFERAASPTIAVNKAIQAVPFNAYWLCITTPLMNEYYFHSVMHDYMNYDQHVPVLAQGRLTEAYPEAPYHVALAHPIGHDSYDVIPGHVRRGAGTVGCALQIAHQKQAKRAILIGVDMCGKGYFDGTEDTAKRSIHPDGVWTQRGALQRVVDWCKGNGMDVVTMSKTQLNMEMI